MKVYNHELVVRRGEAFTIDKIVKNRDDSPYIISSELQNPYFLITVTDSLNVVANQYVCYIWLPVALPRFYSTTPLNILDFKDQQGNSLYKNGWSSLTGLPAGLINGETVEYTSGDETLFYWEKDGLREYRYWNGESWEKYECRLIFKFTSDYTKEWKSKNYFYSIDLVSGVQNVYANSEDAPLSRIDDSFSILEFNKINVLPNLRGGIN